MNSAEPTVDQVTRADRLSPTEIADVLALALRAGDTDGADP
ncbi:mycothiol synthase, partial [Micromonospora azadirachtae]